MHTFKFIFPAIRLPVLSALMLSSAVLSGCQSLIQNDTVASQPSRTAEHYVHPKPKAHTHTVSLDTQVEKEAHELFDIWSRMRQGYQLVDLIEEQPRIDTQLRSFSRQTGSLETIAQRSSPYIHYIIEQLEEHSMPLELALLPAIESAFNPLALSSQRASGLWQFMPATGRNFKLEQTHWYDARRDVTRSTLAAITYLQYLNNMFDGDWLLSLAAYNAGEGTVLRAIKRNRTQGLATDYWSLKLPPQTMTYVPKLLALAKVFAEPEAYNLQLPEIMNEPYFTKVKFKHELELSSIARMAQLDHDQLYQLNPAFNQKITLGGPGYLLIPTEKAELLHQRLRDFKAPQLYRWPTYQVRSGDTLSHIARRQGVSVKMLRDLNKLASSRLSVGQVLKLPPKLSAVAVANTTTRVNYKVRAGDSLSVIAERYQVSVSDIKQWNKLKGNSIRVGQSLRIQSPATYYTVRTGDSLSSIASRHNISINQLKSWNMLNSNLLKPGQKLALYL